MAKVVFVALPIMWLVLPPEEHGGRSSLPILKLANDRGTGASAQCFSCAR